ncbi:MAG TPA: hypothetical protein VIK35_05765 [Verrucomicrobiae bacterium]
MKTLKIIYAITLAFTVKATAEDHFPIFSETPLKVAIPTGMQGYQPTPEFVVGTNAFYTLIGQIFTNEADGKIQTTSKGFRGTTDKSTPWRTLTELLAVYQQGSDEKKIRSLYNASSQTFLDKIYGTPEMTAKMHAHGSSIAGMQAALGFDFKDGFVAFVKETQVSGTSFMNTFYFVKANGVYLVSTFRNSDKSIQNIEVFFNTHSAAELIK